MMATMQTLPALLSRFSICTLASARTDSDSPDGSD
jgi:hypothetical protein